MDGVDGGERSRTTPVVPGCCRSTPNTAVASSCSTGPTMTSMPRGSARVATTATVCGWVSASTKKALAGCFVERRMRVIASAAAVDSSSIEAFAIPMPVRSLTMVWKLRSASSRPWLISGW